MSPDHIINPVKLRSAQSGRYRIRKYRGPILLEETYTPNVLVNGFFDALLQATASSPTIKGVLFGSGTGAPSETDTALGNYLGGGNMFQGSGVIVNSTVAPRSITRWMTVRCAEGAVVGNVSELGMYWGASGTELSPNSSRDLVSRARIVDGGGSPTTITVLSDEFLEVTFYWTIYTMDSVTGTLTINITGTPTDFDYEIRPVSMGNTTLVSQFTGNVYAMRLSQLLQVNNTQSNNINVSRVTSATLFDDPSGTGTPTGGNTGTNNFATSTLGSYSAGSKTRLQTLRCPLNNGNISAPGIRSFLLQTGEGTSFAYFQHRMLLDGPFQKLSSQVFDLPVQITLGNA